MLLGCCFVFGFFFLSTVIRDIQKSLKIRSIFGLERTANSKRNSKKWVIRKCRVALQNSR